MWEKFKESKFAKKCKELSKRGGVVAVSVCILLVLTVVLSVSIATNRAKKQYGVDSSDTNGSTNETIESTQTDNSGVETEDGTVNAPTHNDENESPVGGDAEEFMIELPVSGIVAKGHDSTIQVWNETLGAYKVHLGLDISAAKGTPVKAAADGTVAKVWDDALMGKCVAIDHGAEVYTFYKNLDPILCEGIEEEASIKCGEQIGKVGESAIAELADEPHLHLEMTISGLAADPMDYFSNEAKDTIASLSDSVESGATEE